MLYVIDMEQGSTCVVDRADLRKQKSSGTLKNNNIYFYMSFCDSF